MYAVGEDCPCCPGLDDELHRVTLDELYKDIKRLDADRPVFVHTENELDLTILSTYCDEKGFHIDVGPLEEDKPRKVKSGRKENCIECGMPIGDCECG